MNEFAADPASRNEAERARDRLIAIGIPAEDIRISAGASTAAETVVAEPRLESFWAGCSGLVSQSRNAVGTRAILRQGRAWQ
jgi:hypothetical protein